MPGPGYESVTITEELFKKLKKIYENNKENLISLGITSFSSFVSRFLDAMIEPYIFKEIINRLIEKNAKNLEKLRQIT